MTEAEWLACNNSGGMPTFLCTQLKVSRTKKGRRKLRLYACACCRRAWHLLTDNRSHQAVELTERFAEGDATKQELDALWQQVKGNSLHCGPICGPVWMAADQTSSTAGNLLAWESDRITKGSQFAASVAEASVQANIIRDIFGNPFQPVAVVRSWLTPTVRSLAQAAYESRILPAGTLDPDRLAVLADALEEAGCQDADILSHCREQGVHVRGCWVVDLLLGKV